MAELKVLNTKLTVFTDAQCVPLWMHGMPIQ